MAASEAQKSLVKRSAVDDVALMPPPPTKRIKRPSEVLDEDDYTDALSDIIARDFFPGLQEAHAQQEYLAALESNNEVWIADAAHKLRQVATPVQKSKNSTYRRERDKTQNLREHTTEAFDTPVGNDGSETPSTAGLESVEQAPQVDTSKLSLSSFQAKYTSEDNESFNTVVDKQNTKRRGKHAYMWTEDQRIPSSRQIAHRERETRLIREGPDRSREDKDSKELVSMSAGAVESRPARPDAWKIKKPDNTFMFQASSVDEDGLETIWERQQAASKAGPRKIVHENTRFPPLHYVDDEPPSQIPPSPSLNTDIIAARDVARATGSSSASQSDYPGGETPRVNGYAFVDEDEPDSIAAAPTKAEPSYRDLLAGQVGDSTPNPFKLSDMRKREDLHHRMVEETSKKKRAKDMEREPVSGNATPNNTAGNMTPAARMLIAKLGRTPVHAPEERMSSTEMWTPGRTPRRKAVR